jgi:hypothetical protein
MRPFLLGSLVLLASSLSAAIPIAPVAPVYAERSGDDIAPATATNGITTLVAWTNAFSVYSEAWSVCTRFLGVESQPQCQSGARAVVASDGKDYLVVRSIGASRFNTFPYANVVAEVTRDSGSNGPARTLNTSLRGGAYAVAWNGSEWLVAIIADGVARIEFLTPDLAPARPPIVLGPSTNVRFVERDGAWWAVRWFDTTSEVIAIDGDKHFTSGDFVTLAGPIAFIAKDGSISIATFDPQHGFGAASVAFTDSRLIAAQPFGGGARAIVQTGSDVRGIVVDATGAVVQSASMYTDIAPAYASLLDDTLFVTARLTETPYTERDLYAAPMNLAPLDAANATLISSIDWIVQSDPVIVSNGERGVVFWTQSDFGTGMRTVYRRDLDKSGLPVGDAHVVPDATMTIDADAAFRGDDVIFVWSENNQVFTRIGDETVVLGNGHFPSVATSAQGTFVVWYGDDYQVRGTPLEGRVPGGFPILPSFSFQYPAAITAIDDGFLVLWISGTQMQSVVISPTGAVRSSTSLGNGRATSPVIAGKLAAWPSTLFAYGDGGRPFERFDPHWGENWAPIAIIPLGTDTYRVFIARGANIYTSDVTMDGAFITGITPLDFIGRFATIDEDNVAVIGGKPVVVTRNGQRVEVSLRGSEKRRSSGLR